MQINLAVTSIVLDYVFAPGDTNGTHVTCSIEKMNAHFVSCSRLFGIMNYEEDSSSMGEYGDNFQRTVVKSANISDSRICIASYGFLKSSGMEVKHMHDVELKCTNSNTSLEQTATIQTNCKEQYFPGYCLPFGKRTKPLQKCTNFIDERMAYFQIIQGTSAGYFNRHTKEAWEHSFNAGLA